MSHIGEMAEGNSALCFQAKEKTVEFCACVVKLQWMCDCIGVLRVSMHIMVVETMSQRCGIPR